MRERQKRQIRTLRAVVRFLMQTVFTNARLRHLKKELLVHYARVMELVAENEAATKHPEIRHGYKSLGKEGLREEKLLPLSRRGRKLARLHPELERALRVPHKNASVAEIADAAERIADALKPHLQVLIEAKYPRNCLTALRKDAKALRTRTEAVVRSRGRLGRSNRELTEELSLARNTIDELDSVLRSLDNYEKYKHDWESANRVGARMGRPSKRRRAARERSAARERLDAEQPTASAFR